MFKVIKGGAGDGKYMSPKCIVNMDDTVDTFTEFVTIGWDVDKDTAVLIQNADTITLGYAYLLIANAFKNSYSQLDEDDKRIVDNTLPITI